MQIYTIIGGVNGAGKSSLTGSLRAERTDLGIVVDPDQLTAQCGGDEYEGGKLAVQRIETALADGVNFTQETTLSGGYPKRLCRRGRSEVVKYSTWRVPVCGHQFRHEYVCMLAMAGVPEEIAIQLVGHANAKMIHEVYMALKPQMLEDARKRLDALL